MKEMILNPPRAAIRINYTTMTEKRSQNLYLHRKYLTLVSLKTVSSHKNTNTINPIVEYIYDFVLISPSSCLLEYWTPSLSIYVFNAQFQIVTVEFQSSLAPTQWEFASLEILLHTHITQS